NEYDGEDRSNESRSEYDGKDNNSDENENENYYIWEKNEDKDSWNK
ncbi:19148_t:CDS:1, partial [Racocetra fulgida]